MSSLLNSVIPIDDQPPAAQLDLVSYSETLTKMEENQRWSMQTIKGKETPLLGEAEKIRTVQFIVI